MGASKLLKDGAGDGARTRDVQLGKTIKTNVISDIAANSVHGVHQESPSFAQLPTPPPIL